MSDPIQHPSDSAPATGGPPAASAGDAAVTPDQVRASLRRVKDPELNLNIVDLGLVYDVRVEGDRVEVDMTLTSPACPSGPELVGGVDQQVRSIPGVSDVTVNIVWTPFWTPEKIEPRVRAYLGI